MNLLFLRALNISSDVPADPSNLTELAPFLPKTPGGAKGYPGM